MIDQYADSDTPGLHDVRARLAMAAREAGRESTDIQLVCVSKNVTISNIMPILDAGERIFGENRVQEAGEKWPNLRALYEGIELHLIGPLQSNKVREAVETFDVIQTVDRQKIADAIANEFARRSKTARLFVEINTGSEPQKAGILPQDADRFIAYCRDKAGLKLEGLMCIPPHDEQCSPHFALLAAIARRNGLPQLSMGMSSDFETAIKLGATYVRVGTAIFGQRPSNTR